MQYLSWAAGRACPVAVSLGQEPLLFLAAAPYFGENRAVPEYEMAGHMAGRPVEVVTDPSTGLPIPATAEIVISGEVPPPNEEHRDEGPFGEWTGYCASETIPAPIIRVKAIYYRDDPIILGMPPFRFRGATTQFGLPTQITNYREQLERAGVEDVLDVWTLAVPGVTVVQICQRYAGHAMRAGLAAVSEYMGRFVIVVDEDINPRDAQEVLWAIGTRCDPETTLSVVAGCPSSRLDPRISPARKAAGDFTSSRAIINACKPFDWKDEFPRTNVASAELRRQVLAKWTELFL